MKYRLISIGIVFLVVTAGSLGFITFESNVVRASTTIYVGSGGGNHSNTIGGGIALASPGDTVFVYSGVYVEVLWIDKTINLIGEDRNTTIIDGMGGNVVWISSTDWVNITGFTITNGIKGIWITSSSFINIQGNEIYSNVYGIFSSRSSNNTYINNIVHDQIKTGEGGGYGFFFSGSPYFNNKIIGNIVYNNDADGIHLEDETNPDNIEFWNNSIINNIVYNNKDDGISICADGRNNFVIGNLVHHNGLGAINPRAGILICWSYNNIVRGNTVHNNDNGIYLYKSINNRYTINNTIAGNMVYNNDIGIRVRNASDNTFIENSIFNNNYSVYLYQQSSGNEFINCTLSNPTYDDFNLTGDSHAILLNTTFNKTRVYYGDTLSDLTVKWFMHVNVIYFNGDPVSFAEIWVRDFFGMDLFVRWADSNGWARWIIVTEYVQEKSMITYFTPHNVSATDGSLWGFASPFMDINKVVVIVLGAPTYLLPPRNLTTKIVNFGNNAELEWEPSFSPKLDHYLIYRADTATGFDFTTPYNSSMTWPNPIDTTWVDPDPSVIEVDDEFYYIVRAANFDESDISTTTNTAGIWTRTFQQGISTFSLPLESFVKKDTEFYCQDMNATYIKWMNPTTHTWMQHNKGDLENNTYLEQGKGYEVKFDNQTKYTFTGLPGAMIIFKDDKTFLGFDPMFEARSLEVWVEPNGDVNLTWWEPPCMAPGDYYEIYYSNTRDGFFGDLNNNYFLVCPRIDFGTNTATHVGPGANDPGTLYYMVVPFNTLGVRGASTYGIGVWTEEYLSGYDTLGIPLKLNNNYTVDWFCDSIPYTVGINYFIFSLQEWAWHATRMPEAAYDPFLVMTEGYQISTSSPTKFTFIGV
jgi:parallel beta-helix repeat protein